jgi:ribonucleoside-diphosphate reductase alpha chain
MYRHAWHAGLKTTYYLRSQGASNIEKATVQVKKEVRGVTAVVAAVKAENEISATETPKPRREYTASEKIACSIEAMRNGGECEACQ